MLVVLPVVLLVELVGFLVGGVRLGIEEWLAMTALMWLTALPFAVLGVVVGVVVPAETAYPVVTALMFLLGYFGGLFNPVSQMPHALHDVAPALPTFHESSLTVSLLSSRNLGAASWLVLSTDTMVLTAALVWRHRVEESRGLA